MPVILSTLHAAYKTSLQLKAAKWKDVIHIDRKYVAQNELKRRHSWNSDLESQDLQQILFGSTTDDQDDDLDGVVPHIPDLVEACRVVDNARVSSSSGSEEEDEEEEAEEEEEEKEEENQKNQELESQKEKDKTEIRDMGQKSSTFLTRSSRPKISLTWVLRGDRQNNHLQDMTHSSVDAPQLSNNNNNNNNNNNTNAIAVKKKVKSDKPIGCISTIPVRTLSEPSLLAACSESGRSGRCSREKSKHRRCRTPRHRTDKPRRHSRFGYEIQDVDAFLTKASLEKPANIPMVLSAACILYQTRIGGYQDEISLPLGMVVNAVFKNENWLYVQTPHGEEGYVTYGSCLPLGILPPPLRSHSSSKPTPCWENHTDVFPQPLGNRTDLEKLQDGTRSECGAASKLGKNRLERDAVSACGERSVDRLYLRAAANAKRNGTKRHTLLVIRSDYNSKGRNTLSVSKGEVVALISGHMKDWFWVRSRDGNEGFIPSVVAGNGFL